MYILHSWSVVSPGFCPRKDMPCDVGSLMHAQNWEFDERGYMRLRDACINNVPIEDSWRRLKGWEIHDKK